MLANDPGGAAKVSIGTQFYFGDTAADKLDQTKYLADHGIKKISDLDGGTYQINADAKDFSYFVQIGNKGTWSQADVEVADRPEVPNTVTDAAVTLTASTVSEGPTAAYTFTGTLSHASQGVTTITTDQGVIEIADGQTVGTLVIRANNGEDAYLDASQLTATITAVSGGNFENLTGVGANATAQVNNTVTDAAVTLTASTVSEGPTAAYTFTGTLSHASQGVTTITTDQGVIEIADGQTVGTLVIPANNGEDAYLDASQLTATITAVSGGNFENLTGVGANATAQVNDHLLFVENFDSYTNVQLSAPGGGCGQLSIWQPAAGTPMVAQKPRLFTPDMLVSWTAHRATIGSIRRRPREVSTSRTSSTIRPVVRCS